MNKADLLELRKNAVPQGVFNLSDCIVESAQGAVIKDMDGSEWIDFSGGIGVVNTGHCHPAVVEAIKEQADRLIHSCFHVSMYDGYILLADKLNQITPGRFEKKTMLANSGAEAVENAIKIARRYTGRSGILCFDNAFHGRTYTGMSLTSKINPYKKGFGPFMNDVYRIPFPNAYRLADGDQSKANEISLKALKKCFVDTVDPVSIAAIIYEPIQGEGGFIHADKAFYQELRSLTQAHGILSIVDEVQSGFGRTGQMFASDVFEIDYDLMTMAKSMASGMPLSAVTGRSEIMDKPQIGGIGGTYGGNPLACAAALATIKLLEDGMLEKSVRIGEKIYESFCKMKEQCELIGEVRGVGAMLAFEMVTDRQTKEPATQLTAQLMAYCRQHKLSMITAGTNSNVIRILVPFTVDDESLQKGLSIIEKGLMELNSEQYY
ncbi:MAG: 4-aminobutyrate--2-oxoglutarate transaminase [Reichenbachiella sp.]